MRFIWCCPGTCHSFLYVNAVSYDRCGTVQYSRIDVTFQTTAYTHYSLNGISKIDAGRAVKIRYGLVRLYLAFVPCVPGDRRHDRFQFLFITFSFELKSNTHDIRLRQSPIRRGAGPRKSSRFLDESRC